MTRAQPELTIELLLNAYASGYFPMAESRKSEEVHWYYPKKRGILPLNGAFHVPKRLQDFIKREPFAITISRAFPDVIRACADSKRKQKDTWINDRIIALYCELWQEGYAHSVECWKDGALAGGVYGVALGGAFFGESMFSRTTNASKVALVTLVERLKNAGYVLLDTQYVNDHLKQFGVQEITRAAYLEKLKEALKIRPEKI